METPPTSTTTCPPVPPPSRTQSPTSSIFFSPYMAAKENSTTPLDLLPGLDDYGDFQARNMSAMMASSGGLVAGPTSLTSIDGTLQHGCGLELNHHLGTGAHTAFFHNDRSHVKRRVQNREAQRRFRERREQEQRTLQQRADELRGDYQTLCDKHAKTSSEVSRLRGENDSLRSEVKNLTRQRWRLMLAVLQWPEGAESPSGPGHAASAPFFDDVRRYLRDMANNNASPHSPS